MGMRFDSEVAFPSATAQLCQGAVLGETLPWCIQYCLYSAVGLLDNQHIKIYWTMQLPIV